MTLRKLRIWWIDDQPDRVVASAKNRIESPNDPTLKGRRSTLSLRPLKNSADFIKLEKDLAEAKKLEVLPDLVIVDQILDRTDGIARRGSSIAVAIRAQAPSVPIVGTSAAEFGKIAELQKDQFIEFFRLPELQSGARIADLYAIAEGFSKALITSKKNTTPPARQTSILSLLDCPVQDRHFLSTCLPGEFIAEWDTETIHAFSRWIWHTLLGRAGFLYDDLEIATILGLNTVGLEKINSTILHKSVYKGIFASSCRRRWWASRSIDLVRAAVAAPSTEPIWKIGRRLVGNRKMYFSNSHASSETEVPDIVAFADGTLKKRIQTTMERSKPIETDTPPSGFEQYRIFTGK